MPKAKNKTIGAKNSDNIESDDMDNWSLTKLKDYLRAKGGRVTGTKKELLLLAKCYEKFKEAEDPTLISQWDIVLRSIQDTNRFTHDYIKPCFITLL